MNPRITHDDWLAIAANLDAKARQGGQYAPLFARERDRIIRNHTARPPSRPSMPYHKSPLKEFMAGRNRPVNQFGTTNNVTRKPPKGKHMDLTSKYKPVTLSEVAGQPGAVWQLQAFVEHPASAAFIFHGPTGVGKSCTAKALAFDLGCSSEFEDLGGITEIPSGKQDGRAVEDLLRSLRLRPMYGSGWKVAIVNEADCMTPQAEAIWLDGLEHLPAKTVIVFTTNNIGRLSERLVGRCEIVPFDGESDKFRDGMAELVQRIWQAETGEELETLPANLGRYELAADNFSIRLALKQITPLIRTREQPPAKVAVPFIRTTEDEQRQKWKEAGRKAAETRKKNRLATN